MKNNKSPVQNKIIAENIKYGDAVVFNKVPKLFTSFWNTETMPQKLNKPVMIPLFKTGPIVEGALALLNLFWDCIKTVGVYQYQIPTH